MLTIGIQESLFATIGDSNLLGDHRDWFTKNGSEWVSPHDVRIRAITGMTIDSCDVIISEDRGLGSMLQQIRTRKPRLQLFAVERKYSSESGPRTKPDIMPFEGAKEITNFGYLIPWPESSVMKTGSLNWWLRELNCLGMLVESKQGSCLALGKSLLTKKLVEGNELRRKTVWIFEPNIWHPENIALTTGFEHLGKQSHLALEEAKKDNVVNANYRQKGFKPKETAQTNQFRILNEKFVKALEEMTNQFPAGSKSAMELRRLTQNIKERLHSECRVIIAGSFSSGKTTLINQLFLDGIEGVACLPVDASFNTSVPLVIKVKAGLSSAALEVFFSKKSTHLLVDLCKEVSDFGRDKQNAEKVAAYWRGLPKDEQNAKKLYYCKYGADANRFFWSMKDFKEVPGLQWFFEVQWKNPDKVERYRDPRNIEILLSKHIELLADDFGPNFAQTRRDNLKRGDLGHERTIPENTYIKSIKLVIGSKTSKESFSCEQITQGDFAKSMEKNPMSWLDPEGQYLLPDVPDLRWMQQAVIIDTPGVGSPRPEHDRLALNQISRTGVGDVIIVVISCRGGYKSLEKEDLQFLTDVLESKQGVAINVLVNWRDKDMGKSINEERDALKKQICVHCANAEVNVTVIDLFGSNQDERQRFNKHIESLIGKITGRAAGYLIEELTELADGEWHEELKKELDGFYDQKERVKKMVVTAAYLKKLDRKKIKTKTLNTLRIKRELDSYRDLIKVLEDVRTNDSVVKDDGMEQICSLLDLKLKEISVRKTLIDLSEICRVSPLEKNKRHARAAMHMCFKWIKKDGGTAGEGIPVEEWFIGLLDKDVLPVPIKEFADIPNPQKLLETVKKNLSAAHQEHLQMGFLAKIGDLCWRLFGDGSVEDWQRAVKKEIEQVQKVKESHTELLEVWIDRLIAYLFDTQIPDWEKAVEQGQISGSSIKATTVRERLKEHIRELKEIDWEGVK